MAAPLRVALCQFGAALGDVEANLAHMRAAMAAAAGEGAQLACFPELCLSGYLLDRAAYTAGLLDATEAAEAVLAAGAAQLGLTVVYGTPDRNGGSLTNAVVLQAPGATRLAYAKTHMDAKERVVFTPGQEFVVAPGGLGLACCYDLAFPEAIRVLALRGARLLLIPMAWEVERGFVMQRVVAARAVENVAHVVCVNQCGSRDGLRFLGDSCAADPLGVVTTRLGAEAGVRVVELDLEWVDRLRDRRDARTYPLLNDRRPDLYDTVVNGSSMRDEQDFEVEPGSEFLWPPRR